jgi:NAD-dependent deacetylase
VRFHGSLWELSCFARCPAAPAAWTDETVPLIETPPRCPHCRGIARPAVVWFGEPIDPLVLAAAQSALDCDLCLAVGTSGVVYPAAALLSGAAARGAYTVEINPEITPASSGVDLMLAGPAEDVLGEIERAVSAPGPVWV